MGILVIISTISFYPSFNAKFLHQDYNIIYKIKKRGFSINYFDFIKSDKHIKQLKNKGVIPYYTQKGVKHNFFRPLSSIFYFFEYKLFKRTVSSYRIVNFILFLLAIFVFYVLLSKFILKPQALIGTVFFALGKTHYALLKNAFAADNLLVFIFIMASLFYFYKYFNERRKKHIYLCITFCVLSLLTKETGIFSIIFILAYDTLFIRTGKLIKRIKNSISKNYLLSGILIFYFLFYLFAGFGAYSLKYISILTPGKYLLYLPKSILINLFSLFLYMPQRGFSANPVLGYPTLTIVSILLCAVVIFTVLYNLKKNWQLKFFAFMLITPLLLYVGINQSETSLLIPQAAFAVISAIFIYNFFKTRSGNLIKRQTMLIGAIIISLFTIISPFYNRFIIEKYENIAKLYKPVSEQLKGVFGDAFLSWRKTLIVLNNKEPKILPGFHSNLLMLTQTDNLKYHIINPNNYVRIIPESSNSLILESYREYEEFFIGNGINYETKFLLNYNFKKNQEFDTKYYTVKILKLQAGKPVKIELISKVPLHDDSILFVRYNSLKQKYEIKRFTKTGSFK